MDGGKQKTGPVRFDHTRFVGVDGKLRGYGENWFEHKCR